MTFDDDMLRFVLDGGTRAVSCKAAGLDWPPPDTLVVWDFKFTLHRRSELSDEDRAGMPYVIRGAEYRLAKEQ